MVFVTEKIVSLQTNKQFLNTYKLSIMENYPILSNEECIWLDLPDDYEFDVDVCLSSIYLQRMVSENPAIEELIKEFDCDIIIE